MTHLFGCAIMKMNLKYYSYLQATASKVSGENEQNPGRGAKGEEVMPIVLAPLNQQLKIVRITADDKLKKHLESLGITVDGEITVLSSSGGSVVVKIKDGRIALDSNLSTKIFVA